MRTTTKKLKSNVTVKVINEISEQIIDANSNANYDVDTTPQIKSAAKQFIDIFKVSKMHLQSLLVIREQFENLIDSKYNTDLNSPNADAKIIINLVRDTQMHLAKNNVPQRTQVSLGLFDMIIGKVMAV